MLICHTCGVQFNCYACRYDKLVNRLWLFLYYDFFEQKKSVLDINKLIESAIAISGIDDFDKACLLAKRLSNNWVFS